jgi:KEOPS complex subunit Pcc1
VPHHEATFRFTTENARMIFRAIEPELSDEVNSRSVTRAWIEDDTVLVLHVEADDTAALRAALNMVLRLVGVADEMQRIV